VSLTREEHLEIARDKLVLTGLLIDPDIAHDMVLLESILTRALQERHEKINPYVQVGRILRQHRDRLGMPRRVATARANEILYAMGDTGFCHPSALCHMEAGDQRIYYLQALALADVYGIPYDAMLPHSYNPFLGNPKAIGFVPQQGARHE